MSSTTISREVSIKTFMATFDANMRFSWVKFPDGTYSYGFHAIDLNGERPENDMDVDILIDGGFIHVGEVEQTYVAISKAYDDALAAATARVEEALAKKYMI